MAGLRSRAFTMSLQQDITGVVESYEKYAWILHDKDIDEDTGELKAPHYHIFLEFRNARYLSGLAAELGVASNFIEVCRNKTGSQLYLTHKKDPDKYQYDDSEVHSNFDLPKTGDELSPYTIGQILHTSENFDIFVAEVCARGLKGNPLSNRYYLLKLWNAEREMIRVGELYKNYGKAFGKGESVDRDSVPWQSDIST